MFQGPRRMGATLCDHTLFFMKVGKKVFLFCEVTSKTAFNKCSGPCERLILKDSCNMLSFLMELPLSYTNHCCVCTIPVLDLSRLILLLYVSTRVKGWSWGPREVGGGNLFMCTEDLHFLGDWGILVLPARILLPICSVCLQYSYPKSGPFLFFFI